jgi:hypothetical protein
MKSMKATLYGWTAALFALFATTAGAATKIAASSCCPLCK